MNDYDFIGINDKDPEKPFWQDENFIKLRDQYYNLLEQEGFEDIEYWYPGKPNYRNPPLKSYAISTYQRRYNENIEKFFRLASWYYWDSDIFDKHSRGYNKQYWYEYAVNGLSPNDIRKKYFPNSKIYDKHYWLIYKNIARIRESQDFLDYIRSAVKPRRSGRGYEAPQTL